MQEFVKAEPLDLTNPENKDRLLLCSKPSQRATRYCRMKAFANHFCVEDSTTAHMQTYDSGVASILQEPTSNSIDVPVNYVRVFKDILKLDYGPVHTPIILLRCKWFKRQDNRGNSTYRWDDLGFLLVNSWHKLPHLFDPFIFSSQATQVFFSDVANKSG